MKPAAWFHTASMRIRWDNQGLGTNWRPLYEEPTWQPITTCPTGERVLLLNRAGSAQVGKMAKLDPWWIGWAPLPKLTPEIRKLIV